MNSVNGVVCNDCGNLIPQSQVDNWLNPHIWRPPTPYYVVRREDRGRARVRSAASAPPDERPSARRRVVNLMEIGGDDTLEELRRLTETIEAARTRREVILHRRLHELLQEAIETAEVYRPSSPAYSVTEPLVKEEPSAADEDKWE